MSRNHRAKHDVLDITDVVRVAVYEQCKPDGSTTGSWPRLAGFRTSYGQASSRMLADRFRPWLTTTARRKTSVPSRSRRTLVSRTPTTSPRSRCRPRRAIPCTCWRTMGFSGHVGIPVQASGRRLTLCLVHLVVLTQRRHLNAFISAVSSGPTVPPVSFLRR